VEWSGLRVIMWTAWVTVMMCANLWCIQVTSTDNPNNANNPNNPNNANDPNNCHNAYHPDNTNSNHLVVEIVHDIPKQKRQEQLYEQYKVLSGNARY
jgi:hypothetical protein